MRQSRAAAVLAGLLTLATLQTGCLLGPSYQRPPIESPATHRPLEGEATEQSLADLPWWEVFQDPALQELIHQALQGSFDLRIAAGRVEEARARAGIAKSFLFPEVNLTGGYTTEQLSTLTDPAQNLGVQDRKFQNYNLGFGMSWEIDLFGRLRRERESATAVFFASQEARRGVAITLVADVARAYFDMRGLDLELEIARRTLQVNDETVAFYRRRVEGGVSNQLELNSAIANRARTAAAIPELEQEIAFQENLIHLLLGQAPGPVPRGNSLDEQSHPPSVPAGLPSALLERRPDVLESEQLLVAANADIGAAKALFFPTISLTGFFGGASHDLSDLANSGARVWSLGAGLFQPLFQGGRIKRNYEAAKARFDIALAQYQRSAFNSFREVADALVSIQKLEEARVERETGVEALRDAAQLSRRRYNAGLSNYLEILIADQNLFDEERLLARTRGSQMDALVELYRALGGGWSPEAMTPAEPGGNPASESTPPATEAPPTP
ncbi:MAG TPA: efflux transporter outer membrane subunit [Candidatus Polarisedimenticolia bacterium]|nr:efflux transporter outer membrane subunit [Candidatus Polarisedimenticolia bacterium]